MSLHDRWHWAGQDLGRTAGPTWFDAQHMIMAGRGRLWGVQERLQALDLLARLPAPRDPLVVEAAVGEVLERGERPGAWLLRTWRDGHGALYQGSDPYTELRAFVHYLRIVAQLTADEVRDAPGDEAAAIREQAARLAEFVQAKAVVLQPQDRRRIGPVRRRPRSVLVEFEPLFYDEGGQELFNWSVSEGYGQGQWLRVDVQESAGGVPFEQAREQVLRRLGGRLLRADGDAGPNARVRLEVAVPEGRWDTAAGQWEVAASTRRTARLRPVGPGRAVILRDQGRREQVDPAWLRRWQGLAAARELQALRIPPRPGADARSGSAEAIWRLLETAGEGALPALCHTVADGFGRDAVGVALDTGFPAGLWPAHGHGEERDCDAGCEEFHRGVRELLQGSGGVARLPNWSGSCGPRPRRPRRRARTGRVIWCSSTTTRRTRFRRSSRTAPRCRRDEEYGGAAPWRSGRRVRPVHLARARCPAGRHPPLLRQVTPRTWHLSAHDARAGDWKPPRVLPSGWVLS